MTTEPKANATEEAVMQYGHLTPPRSSSATSIAGGSIAGVLGSGQAGSRSASGAVTPGSDTAEKGRRYLLSADDTEIRQILQARLEREASDRGSSRFPRTRLRDVIFTKRFSTFDRQNPRNAESPFFGFFTLFWLGMFLLLTKVAAQNWKDYGSVLGKAEILHLMFDRDIVVLGLSDAGMILTTLFGLGLQKLIQYEYLSWRRSGWIIQNVWQFFFLVATIGFTLYREWPWTHTIFIVLHCLVYVMKQHSYAFTNGYLSQLHRRRKLLAAKLEEVKELEIVPASPVSPQLESIKSTGFMAEDSNGLHRRPPLGARVPSNPKVEQSPIGAVIAAIDEGKVPDAAVIEVFSQAIQFELDALNDELNGKTKDPAKQYPNNLTISNWADWSCLPTLVYHLEYPRQESINWYYVAEKTIAFFGVIWTMIVISQSFIYPRVTDTVRMKEAGMSLQERWLEFPWVVSDLLFPMLLEQLLAWYVIWECALNVLAELTRFADRNFYGLWWNSTSWSDYARDWNRPVHEFLLRHVYNSSISSFHLSRGSATFITFLLSALVHELVMLCLFKKVRGYLFTMQLLQLPLAQLSRTRLLKDRKILGNLVFWFGLFVGPSIITSLYLIV